jgi:thiol-disulfide isomerase/thioredoxin
MAKARIGFGVLAAAVLLGGAVAAHAAPAPQPAQMLQFKPRQPGINIGTPTDADIAKCAVELVKGQKLASGKSASGWLLKDPQGRPLRRFYDSDGDNQIDVWSYYLNGEECYREVDTNANGKPDQFRWLGPNGSKWGVDVNEDGKIDNWKVISPEEVSQEIFAAVRDNDFARLQALTLSKADVEALELPTAEANRLTAKLANAGKTFQTTAAALTKVGEKGKWVHLELAPPECTTADALGGKADLIRYKSGTILFSVGEKDHDFLQTGELVLVGRAWRVLEAPVPGNVAPNANGGGAVANTNLDPAVKDFIDELKKIDEKYKDAGTPALIAEYNLARAVVLEKIVNALKDPKEREEWIKQVADCYSTAAQNGNQAAHARLVVWKAAVVKDMTGSPVVPYVVYREMSAEYSIKLTTVKPADMPKLQEEWKDKLAKFVQDYPASEDAPDALMQLGMVNEFVGKETEAKNWYGDLVKNFAKSPMAPKAEGAIKRLGLEGQPLELTAPVLGTKAAFDLKSLKGKVVIVYYWAGWNGQCVSDFAKIKDVLSKYGPKGVELVTVNLDAKEEDAAKFLQNTPVAGTHLHQPGGLDSPPAVSYGIMVLPNTFVVDATGKVANRNAQIGTLEDDLKKLVK